MSDGGAEGLAARGTARGAKLSKAGNGAGGGGVQIAAAEVASLVDRVVHGSGAFDARRAGIQIENVLIKGTEFGSVSLRFASTALAKAGVGTIVSGLLARM